MLFTGKITADAAVREVGGNKKVTGFTVAINDRYTSKGDKKKLPRLTNVPIGLTPDWPVI